MTEDANTTAKAAAVTANAAATVAGATTERAEHATLILEDRIKRCEVEMDQKELAFSNAVAKANEEIKRFKKLLNSLLRPVPSVSSKTPSSMITGSVV